jgi:hypothetical protein
MFPSTWSDESVGQEVSTGSRLAKTNATSPGADHLWWLALLVGISKIQFARQFGFQMN